MALIGVPTQLSRSGISLVWATGTVASVNGDSCVNDGRTILAFGSTNLGAVTVTFPLVTRVDGLAPASKVLTVPSSADGVSAAWAITDTFPVDYNDFLGRINWTYSTNSGITIAAYRVSRF